MYVDRRLSPPSATAHDASTTTTFPPSSCHVAGKSSRCWHALRMPRYKGRWQPISVLNDYKHYRKDYVPEQGLEIHHLLQGGVGGVHENSMVTKTTTFGTHGVIGIGSSSSNERHANNLADYSVRNCYQSTLPTINRYSAIAGSNQTRR